LQDICSLWKEAGLHRTLGFVPGDAAPTPVHRTDAPDDSDIRTFLNLELVRIF